jgi:hypothetical protein
VDVTGGDVISKVNIMHVTSSTSVQPSERGQDLPHIFRLLPRRLRQTSLASPLAAVFLSFHPHPPAQFVADRMIRRIYILPFSISRDRLITLLSTCESMRSVGGYARSHPTYRTCKYALPRTFVSPAPAPPPMRTTRLDCCRCRCPLPAIRSPYPPL